MSINSNDLYCPHLFETFTDDLKEKYSVNSAEFISPHYLFHINQTIHYQALVKNNYDDYNNYTVKQSDHNESNFNKLRDNFDIDNMNKISVTFNNIIKKYIVTDGIHRLCLMLYNNIINNNSIPVEFLNIVYDDDSIDDIKNNLQSTTSQTYYNGWNNRTQFGYHGFNIGNINILGQRQPYLRILKMKQYVNFNDMTIMDFGCNTGGMLFHLPEIATGYGFDYSETCIVAANNIKNIIKYNSSLHFDRVDLNDFKLDMFIENNKIENIDIILLLSLGSWIDNWKELYEKSFKYGNQIILETNNDSEGKIQLDLFKNFNAKITLISSESDDDTTGNIGRKTYLIEKN
jgi:hypothetical protein